MALFFTNYTIDLHLDIDICTSYDSMEFVVVVSLGCGGDAPRARLGTLSMVW